MIPMPGRNIRATAATVVDEVSNWCSTFSVVQKPSSPIEIASSFHSATFVGPRSASALRIASLPPAISSVSAGSMRVMMKYSAIDISTANGAAATNHSSQVIDCFSVFSMNPIATMFWAAAVLMPTFQIEAVCAVVIISSPAKRLRLSTPNARMIPMMIGTRQATRAVVLGTKNERTIPTRIAPITTRLVRAPTLDRIRSAMRLSSPVTVIAADRKSAAATRARAVFANPPRAIPSAAPVPRIASGLAGFGARPSMNAMSAAMITALTA